jgi:hypothetical protein
MRCSYSRGWASQLVHYQKSLTMARFRQPTWEETNKYLKFLERQANLKTIKANADKYEPTPVKAIINVDWESNDEGGTYPYITSVSFHDEKGGYCDADGDEWMHEGDLYSPEQDEVYGLIAELKPPTALWVHEGEDE